MTPSRARGWLWRWWHEVPVVWRHEVSVPRDGVVVVAMLLMYRAVDGAGSGVVRGGIRPGRFVGGAIGVGRSSVLIVVVVVRRPEGWISRTSAYIQHVVVRLEVVRGRFLLFEEQVAHICHYIQLLRVLITNTDIPRFRCVLSRSSASYLRSVRIVE